jgi:hypothetical protein
MTPSRARFVNGESVKIRMPFSTGIAQLATGYKKYPIINFKEIQFARHTLGVFSISTRHIRQLPAIDKRS